MSERLQSNLPAKVWGLETEYQHRTDQRLTELEDRQAGRPTGTATWTIIRQGGGIDYDALDHRYLRLSSDNDPLTGDLDIRVGSINALRVGTADIPPNIIPLDDLTYPSTPIVDDFNRAAEGPPPSSQWTTIGAGGLEIVSGNPGVARAVRIDNGDSFSELGYAYWNTAVLSTSQEVYTTTFFYLSGAADNLNPLIYELGVRTTITDGQIESGYALVRSWYSNGMGDFGAYDLYRIVGGIRTLLASVDDNILSGDRLGLRVHNSTIQVWRVRSFVPEVLISVSDALVPYGPYIYAGLSQSQADDPFFRPELGPIGGGALSVTTPGIASEQVFNVNTTTKVTTAQRVEVTIADGTSPFIVTSTTLNTNLNADLLDGRHASEFVLGTRVITTTAPLTIDGGSSADLSADRTLAMSQAGAASNGWLSSTDWNTFNNKQPAGNYITALTGDITATGPGSVAATLATVNANVGTFGSATQVAQVTVNAKGLVTAAANVTISGVTPAAHDIAGVLHTTSGRTAGQVLQATGVTAFGWSTNTLTIGGNSTINGSLVGNITGSGTLATGGFIGTLPKTGTLPVGTGIAGRIAEWVTDVNTLQASTLTKTGVGVLTLSAAANYTLTIPATGTAALLATSNNFTAGQTITVAGTQLTLVNGSTNTTIRNESYGWLTITPSGGAVNIPAALYTNSVSISRDIAAQVTLSTANDLWYVYPFFTLDRSRGTQASRTDCAAGDISGGVNFYARYTGTAQGVATFGAYVDTASGSYITGKLVFNVNNGLSGGANGFGFSVRHTGVVIGTDTTPTGRLNIIGSSDVPQLYVVGHTTQSDAVAKLTRNDGATNTINTVLTVGANSTGTAAAGFGARQLWTLKSNTTADQSAAAIDAVWQTATHASAVSDMVLSAAYNSGAAIVLSEFLRGRGGATPLTGIGAVANPTAIAHLAPSVAAAASLRLEAGTAPTSPNAGDVWNDSTQKAEIAFLAGIKQSRVGCIYSSYATVTVANTTTETTLLGGSAIGTLTLPANFWTVGKTIRVTGFGIHTTPDGSPTIRNRLKLGSVTVGDTGALVDKNDTNTEHDFLALITCRTTGATGTVYCEGRMLHHEGSTDASMMPFENTATSTIDTTAAMTIDLTVQFSTNTGISMSMTNVIVEVLN